MKLHIKRYLKVFLASGILLGATGCSDSFFELDNPNQVSESTYWKTEADALAALAACYDGLQSTNLYNDNIDGWQWGFLARETCTDNGDKSWGNWMLGSCIAECTSATNSEEFSNYWNANYEIIKRCNVLVVNIDRVSMDEAKRDAYKAEAIALRALCYCNLISVFRDVPYLTAPLTMSNPEAPKTLKKDIVAAVLADMKTNAPLLPTVKETSVGRMSREAAYAIAGRMALFAGEWAEAVSFYKNVIGKVQLFKSGDGTDFEANYADLFTEANETHEEVLLGVHYNGPGLGEGQTFGVCWGGPMGAIEATMNLCDDYYCIDGQPISVSPLFEGSLEKGAHTLDKIDWGRYNNRDPRMKGTLFLPGMTWNGTVYDYNPTKLPAMSTCCIRKWYTPENTANEYDGSQDYYIIRYAEVLLSLAEAMNDAGTYAQAEITPYINEVRARVGMPAVEDVATEGTGLSQDRLREIIRHERRVELAFEDLRFADLYRWNDFANAQRRMRETADFYGGGHGSWNFSVLFRPDPRGPQDSVWPIPLGEIQSNSLLEQHAEWQ